ncbi:DUF5906 domain-containing protein [Nitrosopumilus sp.]|uniref:DUF5906 domain-containing protein n=1 Tax=Nitrosopumilus sp. TaxID=2024843 RepID=UPI00292D6736|nr:DUF5906 domain-containing protein [Nitrosopumilus sp.]
MTLEHPQSNLKEHYIKLFRDHKFNCFPIPKNQKIGDYRYNADKTSPNQIISLQENYGVLPTVGNGNAIIDIDNKERYRTFAQTMIADGYMVIESPHGWHIPVIGLGGQISKTELFDYEFQPDKKIIEIQGPKHYCVGVESQIIDDETGQIVRYQNRGTQKIWDAKGADFHEFIDALCKACSVTSRKRSSRSGYRYLRERFLRGELPLKGSSNDYFFQAALQCNTDELSKDEAIKKIGIIYHKWSISSSFSGRPWSNIETKINEVYENNLTTDKGRPRKENQNNRKREINTTDIAQELIEMRNLYSDINSGEIFENNNGFLEKINKSLQRDLLILYPELEHRDLESILFKLSGLAKELPPTNKDLIVFKNGVYDRKIRTLIETEEIADMGFKEFDYLPPNKQENKPVQFLKIMFENVDVQSHSRIKGGLKSILSNYLDPKISVIYGNSGVGKSTPLTILANVLGEQYSLVVELNQFLEDKFIRAKIMNMRLLVFQDMPKVWKEFTILKTITGEQRKTERGFQRDSVTFDNKLKIWASGNYLATIPDEEKDAMYTRRLSLIHNTRKNAYNEDPEFAEKIVQEEGEKIISWILNLPDEECEYEGKDTVRREWESIASPEIKYLQENYEPSTDILTDFSVMELVRDFEAKLQQHITIEQMIKSLKSQGYVIRYNIVKNLKRKSSPKPEFSDQKQAELV